MKSVKETRNQMGQVSSSCKFTHQLVFVIWLQLSPLVVNGPRGWWVWMWNDFFVSWLWLLNHRLRSDWGDPQLFSPSDGTSGDRFCVTAPPFVRAEPGAGDTHLPQVSPFCSTCAVSWVTWTLQCQVSLEPSLNCNTCILARHCWAVAFLEILWSSGVQVSVICLAQLRTRCPSAHLPYKHHRDTSHQLLLKCLLRSNFRTTDWNTMSRGVEYF